MLHFADGSLVVVGVALRVEYEVEVEDDDLGDGVELEHAAEFLAVVEGESETEDF